MPDHRPRRPVDRVCCCPRISSTAWLLRAVWRAAMTVTARLALSADRFEARSPVAQRPLHYRAYGAQDALRRRRLGARLRRLHASHLCLARGSRATDDL